MRSTKRSANIVGFSTVSSRRPPAHHHRLHDSLGRFVHPAYRVALMTVQRAVNAQTLSGISTSALLSVMPGIDNATTKERDEKKSEQRGTIRLLRSLNSLLAPGRRPSPGAAAARLATVVDGHGVLAHRSPLQVVRTLSTITDFHQGTDRERGVFSEPVLFITTNTGLRVAFRRGALLGSV